jgi:hypothetical protein
VGDDADSVHCFRAPEIFAQDAWTRLSKAAAPAASVGAWRVVRDQEGLTLDSTPVTHGAWRGCVENFCWGPNESAHTLARGPEQCRRGALVTPCDVADQSALAAFAQDPTIGMAMNGDLFACARFFRGVRCIGASRDGFFGTARECPPQLFRAWPTANGTVPAPHAKCSSKPVPLGRGSYFGNDGFAGPRGVCLEIMKDGPTEYRCFGGVPTPALRFGYIAVGLGDEPSACGIRNGEVQCWGAGYSRAPGELVSIAFEVPRQKAVAWVGEGPFHAKCGVNRNCGRTARALPACADRVSSLNVEELLALSRGFEGLIVAVRGELVLAGISSPSVAVTCCPCRAGTIEPDTSKGGGDGNFCCLEADAAITITDGREAVVLDGHRCAGDTSRVCCGLPVLGQRVTATGRLVFREQVRSVGPMWTLADATLCEDRSD